MCLKAILCKYCGELYHLDQVTKEVKNEMEDELRPEYDFAQMEGGVRGKYVERLDKNRPMTTITIRIPEDVIEDLKRIAPLLGFSGYQP